MKNKESNTKEKFDAFLIGFAITIIIASLISLALIAYLRMENTISGNDFAIVDIQKTADEGIKILTFEKEYFLNFKHIGEIIGKYSFYDLFIPAKIRAFLAVAKSASNGVTYWLQSDFY